MEYVERVNKELEESLVNLYKSLFICILRVIIDIKLCINTYPSVDAESSGAVDPHNMDTKCIIFIDWKLIMGGHDISILEPLHFLGQTLAEFYVLCSTTSFFISSQNYFHENLCNIPFYINIQCVMYR